MIAKKKQSHRLLAYKCEKCNGITVYYGKIDFEMANCTICLEDDCLKPVKIDKKEFEKLLEII